jgi:hypothetical protein
MARTPRSTGLADPAAGVGRGRVRPEGIERGPLRQGAQAVDGAAQRVHHPAEPGFRRAHAPGLRAHLGRAAPAHPVQRAEGQRQRPVAGESDHLAGHHGPLPSGAPGVDADVEPPAELHGAHGARHLDEQAAHRHDAAEHLQVGRALQGATRRRDATVRFLVHGRPPSTFRLPLSLTLGVRDL